MSEKIKVAIVGLGNCASSLVQGIEYYKNAKENEFVPGLMHVNLGGYHVRDVEFVAAFEVNAKKVGKDIGEAIFAEPNNSDVFAKVGKIGAKVYKAPVMDGINKYLAEVIPISKRKDVDAVKVLKQTGAEIVLNYLPVGSEKATRFWADACIKAGIGFINCIPVFIASDKKWAKKFEDAGLPVIGDDIKAQVGATITHRTLVNLFLDRGMPIDRTYQLNTGGNCDFLNMLERERLKNKKISKTNAVKSQIEARGLKIRDEDIHIGPSDYVPWQKDNKVCFIRIESRNFGNLPHDIEVRLSVADSPNSAGVVIDAIRCMKLALNNGLKGALIEPSAYFKKSPPKQFEDRQARRMVEEYIERYGKK
ncbi:inositol-3-phosphate synthase [Candidatus Dojkabacteria bacterium]|nr:inositol-3-phosphate synthase [Candidatus Dojkabacteria bacterium]